MHSWQNGIRCRDSGKYCGVIPIKFGWFLKVPSLHVLVFIQRTFFCDLLLLFFCCFFLGEGV